MKNLFYFTLIFFSFLGMTLNVNGQDLSDIANLKMPDHPRILWFEEDINPLVQEISKEVQWQKIHQAILSESDKMLGLPTLERIQIGKRLLDKSRECLKRVFYLSNIHVHKLVNKSSLSGILTSLALKFKLTKSNLMGLFKIVF